MRFEPLSMPVRSHGQPMTALTDMPPRPMFPYNDLVRELEFALSEGDEKDLSGTLTWLEPALRNRLVNYINIEWNDQGVWIGLSDDILQDLSLSRAQAVTALVRDYFDGAVVAWRKWSDFDLLVDAWFD
jgi:hypothetical protein